MCLSGRWRGAGIARCDTHPPPSTDFVATTATFASSSGLWLAVRQRRLGVDPPRVDPLLVSVPHAEPAVALAIVSPAAEGKPSAVVHVGRDTVEVARTLANFSGCVDVARISCCRHGRLGCGERSASHERSERGRSCKVFLDLHRALRGSRQLVAG